MLPWKLSWSAFPTQALMMAFSYRHSLEFTGRTAAMASHSWVLLTVLWCAAGAARKRGTLLRSLLPPPPEEMFCGKFPCEASLRDLCGL